MQESFLGGKEKSLLQMCARINANCSLPGSPLWQEVKEGLLFMEIEFTCRSNLRHNLLRNDKQPADLCHACLWLAAAMGQSHCK